jgi:nuclear pore complex protein Nup88
MGHMKSLTEEHIKRINAVKMLIENFETKEGRIHERIERACEYHAELERRLNKLKSLPLANNKPLSKAEKDFRAQLGMY